MVIWLVASTAYKAFESRRFAGNTERTQVILLTHRRAINKLGNPEFVQPIRILIFDSETDDAIELMGKLSEIDSDYLAEKNPGFLGAHYLIPQYV